MALKLMLADITRERADAIVTPASREPRIGTGVDSAIHAAAGKKLLDERKKLGDIGPGVVHATSAFKLAKATKAKYVIHCLGPVYDPKLHDNSQFVLAYTYLLVLLKAKSLGCRTVSIPLLSSGNFNMPLEKATDIAVDAIGTYLEADKNMTVNLLSINPGFQEYAKRKYGKLHRVSGNPPSAALYARSRRPNVGSLKLHEKLDYFKNVNLNQIACSSFAEALRSIWERYKTENAERAESRRASTDTRLSTYHDLADATGISFSTIRKYMSRYSAKVPKPSKEKLIAILVALRVTSDIAEVMLKKCGYSFQPGSNRDATIRRYLDENDGGITGLNCKLDKKNLRLLMAPGNDKASKNDSVT